MLKSYVVFFFLVVCFENLHAQSLINGTILDAHDQPVPYANVLLLRAADNVFVKGALSGTEGVFQFQDLPYGGYRLEISIIGFRKFNSATFENTKAAPVKDFGRIVLQEDAAQLREVAIVAKKPLFEQKIDRLVVNVASSITSAGATALDILERSPGVIVNRQNNILSLAGKDGVLVMINGKLNHMPPEAVVQMLQGMPSGNIEKIELITTPPANYDAEGNAGFINIVLKQTTDQGLNGSFTLTAGYGKGDASSAGINFNYRKGRFNLYGEYSVSHQAPETNGHFIRQVELNGESILTETNTVRNPSAQRNHNARLGFDLNLGKKNILGVLLSGYDNRYSQLGTTGVKLSYNGIPDTLITTQVDEVNHWQHLGGNVNFQHTFEKGAMLTFDADLIHYYNENPANYHTSYTDNIGNFLYYQQTFSGKKTPIDVSVGKMDYSKQFSEKVKIDIGLKATFSRFVNDVTVSKLENGTAVIDPSLTAKYHLQENIGAAYSALQLKPDNKTEVKLGLRYEYTTSNLGTLEQPNIVDRHYGEFFPSFFLSRTINEQQSTNFSYSRRITRPTFNDLAPFVFFFDPFSFFSGNAAIQPSISNSLKLDYRFKTALFSLQYSVEDSAITRFQSRNIPGTNKFALAAANMKNRKTAALTIAFPIQLAKWWQMQSSLIGSWQEANNYFNKDLVQVRAKNLNLVMTNTFTLPAGFSAEISGFYQSKGLFGSTVSLPLGAINLGLQKKFEDNGGALRIGIDDLLNTVKFRYQNDLPQYNLVGSGSFNFTRRTFKLTYSRNFGNKILKEKRNRETGSEEERQRVGN